MNTHLKKQTRAQLLKMTESSTKTVDLIDHYLALQKHRDMLIEEAKQIDIQWQAQHRQLREAQAQIKLLEQQKAVAEQAAFRHDITATEARNLLHRRQQEECYRYARVLDFLCFKKQEEQGEAITSFNALKRGDINNNKVSDSSS